MYKIGLVGLKSSIDQILSMVEEFKHDLEFIPYTYEKIEEIEKIVIEHAPHVHAWLFQGHFPMKLQKIYRHR
ncbi:hypothetical protein AAHB56_00870 [Bacillus thuringiensis]